MESTPVIELQDLSFAYHEDTPIFSHIDLCVHKGDYLTIIGPNGGGKSTLIKLMTGLLAPTSGRLLINGLPHRNARTTLGYVPQQLHFDKLFPTTAQEAVLTGTLKKGWGFYTKKDKEIAREALGMVGMEGFACHSFSALSGGQRQRVLIARALASHPEILILDEPTASVDSEVERQFRELLFRLNKELTIILVTHDFGFVDRNVSRVFCVNHAVVEHPADRVNEDLISSSYGRSVKAVSHDQTMEPHHHNHQGETR
ncbi:MAG: metal ABC transporter ATP-binding protein [Spirochaetales bacterium]|nr:metal ABC transporter ATP-binding protein [Spirochaetales bacterium]